jgi:hypothetical protein
MIYFRRLKKTGNKIGWNRSSSSSRSNPSDRKEGETWQKIRSVAR